MSDNDRRAVIRRLSRISRNNEPVVKATAADLDQLGIPVIRVGKEETDG